MKLVNILMILYAVIIATLIALTVVIIIQANQMSKEYQRGYTDGVTNTDQGYFDDQIDIIEDYYELYTKYKVLEERLEWLSPDTVVHKFDKTYNFYLLVVVSRTKVNDDIWLYGLQEVGNNHETVYVESNELFSVSEQVIAVEINRNQVILIDIS